MRKIITFLIFMSSLLLGSKTNAAILPDYTPLMPFAPQLCFQCTPATIGTVTAVLSQLPEMEKKFEGMQSATKDLKSLSKYPVEFGKTKLNDLRQKYTSRKKVVSHSRTIEDCNIAGNIEDDAKVKEAFVSLFLQYPSKDKKTKKKYKEKGEQFLMDTTMEMYIAAREMSMELDTMLAELNTIEKCLVAGEKCDELGMNDQNCQKSDSEDKMCMWRNALSAVRIYDKIMRYNVFLTELNAEYKAAHSIDNIAKIKEYDSTNKEEKESSLIEPYFDKTEKIASFKKVEEMSFALLNKNFEMLDNAKGVVSPVEDKEAEFESLKIISETKEKLNEAFQAHNFKQTLPEYRNIFKNYNEVVNYHNKTLENLAISEECVTNYLSKYYTNGINSWTGNNCKRQGSNYECHYTPEKKVEDKTPSIGKYDVFCADDKSVKCYVIDVEKKADSSGIFGWLMALQSEAQTAESLSDDDIYMSEELDVSEDKVITPLSKMKQDSNNKYNNDKTGNNVKALKKPSMEEDLYAESRANALLNWTLGSQVSKMINQEVVNNKSGFGTTRSITPLWNDQKRFYDLYLSGKYANIKKYLQEASLVDPLAKISQKIKENSGLGNILNTATGEIENITMAQRKGAEKYIAELLKLDENNTPEISELDKLLAEEKTSLETIRNNYFSQLNSLKARKQNIYKELDTNSNNLSKARDIVNNNNSQIVGANNNSPKSENAIESGKTLERGTEVSPRRKDFESDISKNSAEKKKAETKKAEAEKKVALYQNKINNGRKQLEEIDNKINEAKSAYVKSYYDKELEYKLKIEEAVKDSENSKLKSSVKKIVSENEIVNYSNLVLQLLRQYAVSLVDETYQKQLALGDRLYYSQSGKIIAENHQEMLNKLKNITFDDLLADNELAGQLKKIPMAKELFAQISDVFVSVLDGKDVPDTDYFVGLVAKERDLTTPKAPVTFSSAPLREVFHFDLEDYDAVLKYYKNGVNSFPKDNKEVTLIGNSLLDSGLDLPEIWRIVLKYRPFVEQNIDFDKFFHSHGNPQAVFRASGIYPCKLSGGDYVTAAQIGYRKAKALPDSKNCVTLAKNGKYIIDDEANVGFRSYIDNDVEDTSTWAESSELGQIMDYMEEVKVISSRPVMLTQKIGRLTFTPAMQNAAYNINNSNIGEDGKSNDVYYHDFRFMFDKNQFGNYLDNVDVERAAAETLAEQKIQIEDLRESLKNMFEQVGYTLSDDFDLTNSGDYKLAEEVLKKHKTANLRRAKDLVASIKGSAEIVETNKKSLLHSIAILEKDNKEIAQVSPDDDLDALSEKIKNAAANQEVSDTYENEGSKSMNNNTKRLQKPYCAVYP